ncbi:MAG TPA: S8 family serine peptidase [Gammaproteobacteria bacterium]|nr:S8 family serine peptidase [Gammaproteobacteria bacterium]
MHILTTNKNVRALLPASLIVLLWSAPPHAGTLTPSLQATLAARASADEIAVIIVLADQINISVSARQDRRRRDPMLVKVFKEKADLTQKSLKLFLKNQGAQRIRPLWVTNGIAARVRADVIPRLAAQPGIAIIQLDQSLLAPKVMLASSAPPEWNLDVIEADDLWALGYSGHGTVIATMDTGVDPYHPDLNGKWRGGGNSWFDPHGEHSTPYDGNGHGTQTMGILVGGAAGGSAIGVAPDARWIAAKIFNDAGQAQLSDIHLAFQWLLDPDGDPNTQDAPDVVNASWGLNGSMGQCVLEFSNDIQILKAAGIGVVFSAGNTGPDSFSSGSPANNPGAFATGAVDNSLSIADFSSRGPSACDGGLFPQLSAPGVNIRTADLSFGGLPLYATVSGTSYAAPHTAGAMALLLGAYPNTGIAALESALMHSVRDLGQPGADTAYGYGLVDVAAAYRLLLTAGGSPPAITSLPVTTGTQGVAYSYTVTATDPDGGPLTFSLDVAPAGMSIDASSGLINWIPSSAQLGSNPVTVRVQDVGGLFATQSFAVTVTPPVLPNRRPVAVNDTVSVKMNLTKIIAVLANDRDPDGNLDAGTVTIVSAPAKGIVRVNADGTVSYKSRRHFKGTDRFRYTVKDKRGAISNVATVKIKIIK